MSLNSASKLFVFISVVAAPLAGFAKTSFVTQLPPAVKSVVASGVQRSRSVGLVVSGDTAKDLSKALQALGTDSFIYKTYVRGDQRPGFSSKLFFVEQSAVVVPFFTHKLAANESELPGNNISDDVFTLGDRTLVYGEVAQVINEGVQNLKREGISLSKLQCSTHAFHSNGESTGEEFSVCELF